jgi:hypothetical protein
MARWERDQAKERTWRWHVAGWRRSGLTVRAYCADQGLPEANFYAWRRTLAERDRQAARRGRQTPMPAFVPVQVVSDVTTSTSHSPFEVVLANGRVLRIGADADLNVARQLLALLEEPAC